MTTQQTLSEILDDKQTQEATAWFEAHKDHVDRLLDALNDRVLFRTFPPSGSDASNPALWKAESWAWFFARLSDERHKLR